MIKRFIIRGVSKRFTGVKKVAPQKPQVIIKQKKRQLFRYDPKKKSIFGIQPPFDPSHPGIKDLTLKAGRTTETATFLRKRKEVRTKVAQHIKIRKAKGEKLFKKTTVWSKPPTRLQPSPPKITVIKRTKFGKQVKKFTDQALTKEFGIAQKTGLIRAKKLGKKLNIGIGGVVKGPKIKPSRIRPRHTRGKDFPDLADDPTIGGVKAYADMPSIKRQLSKMAKQAPAYTAKYLSPTNVRYTIIKKGRFKGSKLKYKV